MVQWCNSDGIFGIVQNHMGTFYILHTFTSLQVNIQEYASEHTQTDIHTLPQL